MMKIKLFHILVAICLVSTMAYAGIEGGEKEIGGAFSIMKPKEGDAVWLLLGTAGYYFNPNFRLSGLAIVTGSGGDDGDTTGIIGVTGDYLFNDGQDMIPYVGAGLSKAVGDDAGSDALVDIHAGLKQFVSENTSINYEAKYSAITDDLGEGTISGTIGFSIYF